MEALCSVRPLVPVHELLRRNLSYELLLLGDEMNLWCGLTTSCSDEIAIICSKGEWLHKWIEIRRVLIIELLRLIHLLLHILAWHILF